MSNGSWPPLPSGFALMGAYGVLLAVPAEWNPVLLRVQSRGGIARWLGGDPAPRGMIALADLRATQLEVRWRTFASHAKAASELEKVVRQLAHSAVNLERREGRVFIHGEKPGTTSRAAGWQVLATAGPRLYELHLSGSENAERSTIVDWFIRANATASPREQDGRYWSLYGCHGWAPREARVETLLLQPGRVEITLAYRGGKLTFGSHALADRLLGEGTSLLAWAKSLRREGRAVGQWQVEGETVRYAGTALQKFCRRIHHEIAFRHAPAENRITWQHRQWWGATGADECASEGIARSP